MNQAMILSNLDAADLQGHWIFTARMLGALFEESGNTLKTTLQRAVKAGTVERVAKGIYVNQRARSMKAPVEALVPYLKPGYFNYVSRETLLSRTGIISQMTLDYMTISTTGSSSVHNTKYGTYEFTHTKKPLDYLLRHTYLGDQGGLRMATDELALAELKASHRNLDMIDHE